MFSAGRFMIREDNKQSLLEEIGALQEKIQRSNKGLNELNNKDNISKLIDEREKDHWALHQKNRQALEDARTRDRQYKRESEYKKEEWNIVEDEDWARSRGVDLRYVNSDKVEKLIEEEEKAIRNNIRQAKTIYRTDINEKSQQLRELQEKLQRVEQKEKENASNLQKKSDNAQLIKRADPKSSIVKVSMTAEAKTIWQFQKLNAIRRGLQSFASRAVNDVRHHRDRASELENKEFTERNKIKKNWVNIARCNLRSEPKYFDKQKQEALAHYEVYNNTAKELVILNKDDTYMNVLRGLGENAAQNPFGASAKTLLATGLTNCGNEKERVVVLKEYLHGCLNAKNKDSSKVNEVTKAINNCQSISELTKCLKETKALGGDLKKREAIAEIISDTHKNLEKRDKVCQILQKKLDELKKDHGQTHDAHQKDEIAKTHDSILSFQDLIVRSTNNPDEIKKMISETTAPIGDQCKKECLNSLEVATVKSSPSWVAKGRENQDANDKTNTQIVNPPIGHQSQSPKL